MHQYFCTLLMVDQIFTLDVLFLITFVVISVRSIYFVDRVLSTANPPQLFALIVICASVARTRRGCKAGKHRRRKTILLPTHIPVIIGNRPPTYDGPHHPDYLLHGLERTPHQHIHNFVLVNVKTYKSTQDTHFCMINARSVRNKTTVDFVCDHKLDIVGICETWISPDDSVVIADMVPPGYSFKHVPRPNKRGGGVGLLYCDESHVNFRKNPQNFNSFESLRAEVVDNAVAIHLVIMYRPPGSKYPFQYIPR